MKYLERLTEDFVKEEKELINVCVKSMNFEDIGTMNENEFKLITQLFKLLDATNKLLGGYAQVLDEMSTKLDRIELISKYVNENETES